MAGITSTYAILTGQQVNAKKSCAFSTTSVRHRPIRLGDACIKWVDGVSSLGAEVVVRDGYERERTDARIADAGAIARRVGWSGLGFDGRAFVLQGAVSPTARYACSVAELPARPLATLRRAVVGAL